MGRQMTNDNPNISPYIGFWISTQNLVNNFANISCERVLAEYEMLAYEKICDAVRAYYALLELNLRLDGERAEIEFKKLHKSDSENDL